jgi:hypothetical protein
MLVGLGFEQVDGPLAIYDLGWQIDEIMRRYGVDMDDCWAMSDGVASEGGGVDRLAIQELKPQIDNGRIYGNVKNISWAFG